MDLENSAEGHFPESCVRSSRNSPTVAVSTMVACMSSGFWIWKTVFIPLPPGRGPLRSEEHTSELQSLMRISYAVFCLKKKKLLIISHNLSINPHHLISYIHI